VIHLDTAVIVDLQRDTAERDAATKFLAEHSAEPLVVSVYALCELEAGVLLARHPERDRARLHGLIAGMAIAYPDHRFIEVYGRTFVALERRGKRMPAMDS
jgi:predicted nucleic acid-binding protein